MNIKTDDTFFIVEFDCTYRSGTPRVMAEHPDVEPENWGIEAAPSDLVIRAVTTDLNMGKDWFRCTPFKATRRWVVDYLVGLGEDQIQFLPLEIFNAAGEQHSEEFVALNILRPCSCVDMSQSHVVFDNGSWLAKGPLVLRETNETKGRQLFYSSDVSNLLVARHSVRDFFSFAGISGLRFIPGHLFRDLNDSNRGPPYDVAPFVSPIL